MTTLAQLEENHRKREALLAELNRIDARTKEIAAEYAALIEQAKSW
jgi:hypothetical protein